MELTDSSREAQDRQALLLRKLEAEKRKRSLVVPTKPSEVGREGGRKGGREGKIDVDEHCCSGSWRQRRANGAWSCPPNRAR